MGSDGSSGLSAHGGGAQGRSGGNLGSTTEECTRPSQDPTIDTISGPQDLSCGGYTWQSWWELPQPAGNDGWVIQEVLYTKHAEVKAFSDQHCSPEMHLSKASGLYLLLRVLFDLPMACPRERAKIFAAITHPSVADRRHPFDLSWPVAVGQDAKVLLIHRMRGHMGRGYDAVGEYDYFVEHFPFRERNLLASLAFRPAPAR